MTGLPEGSVDLVIFDCDGVLVDTERLTNAILAEMTTEAGWAITAEDSIRMFKGRDLHLIQTEVEERVGKSLGPWIERYRERMFASFENGLNAIPGARELLELADPRFCIASNGPVKKMNASLSATGLAELVGERLHSAYDVGKWKPEPDLFLHAARSAGVDPSRCVVIEDSASGVEAGVRAGMGVLGFADLSPSEKLATAGAHAVFTDLGGLGNALRPLLS